MRKMLSSKRGEMHIEAVVTIMILVAFMVFAMSVFRVSTVKNRADAIADTLLETATFYGCYGEEFDQKIVDLQNTYPNLEFTVSYDGDWYNSALERVQLGDTMTVTVYYKVTFGGFGSFLTLDLHSTRTGASENYWKTVS